MHCKEEPTARISMARKGRLVHMMTIRLLSIDGRLVLMLLSIKFLHRLASFDKVKNSLFLPYSSYYISNTGSHVIE